MPMHKFLKKSALPVLAGFLLSGCLLVDSVGLNPTAIKGSEASSKIINAAIIADVVSSNGRIGILTVLADVIAGIEPGAYYTKSSVENCEKSINGVIGYVAGSLLANVLKCDIVKDPIFIKIGPVAL